MIKVNQDLCLGCGVCASICSDTFKMNETSGKADVINQNDVACAQNALASCPVQAIEIK